MSDDPLEQQLIQEEIIDKLLEKPEKKYNDIQDLVSDYRLEEKREQEGAISNFKNDNNNEEEDEIENTNKNAFKVSVDPVLKQAIYRTEGPQTGPKGVIADQKAHQQHLYENWQRENQSNIQFAKSNAITVKTIREEEVDEKIINQLEDGLKLDDLENELEFDDEEDEFLKSYREKRIAELKAQMMKPSFGVYKELNVDSYFKILQHPIPNIISIIHLYNNDLVACRRLTSKLIEIAPKHKQIQFCGAEADQVGAEEFEIESLPAILIYKNGELMEALFQITKFIGSQFSSKDVEVLLTASGVLKFEDVDSEEE